VKAKKYTPESNAKRRAAMKKAADTRRGKPSWNSGKAWSEEYKNKQRVTALKQKRTFKQRGGNGAGPTKAQELLHQALGPQWVIEFPISLGPRQPNYPTCYKADLALPSKKWIVEVDGGKHGYTKQKALDRKRDTKLSELGWKTLRLKNSRVMQMYLTLNSKEIRTFVQKAF
jgi:hypothetical protein